MKPLSKKSRWILHILTISILIFLLISAISARIDVVENESYFSKREVSLYILTYKELPENFYTKAEAESLFGSRIDALIEGYNIGGDTFYYYGAIIALTDNQDLRECDIYTDRESLIEADRRGVMRLVFTTDGDEVFYTKNHYDSFVRMTHFRIQLWSNVLFIIIFAYSFLMIMFYWFLFGEKDLNGSIIVGDLKEFTYLFFMLPFIPIIYIYKLFQNNE